MPRDCPIEIRRGNNTPPVVWRFRRRDGTVASLGGSVFALAVAWPELGAGGLGARLPAGEIAHSSDPAADATASALAVDLTEGAVTWPYTLAESEAIPRLVGVRYVLRRAIPDASGVLRVRDWAGGPVTVRSFLP